MSSINKVLRLALIMSVLSLALSGCGDLDQASSPFAAQGFKVQDMTWEMAPSEMVAHLENRGYMCIADDPSLINESSWKADCKQDEKEISITPNYVNMNCRVLGVCDYTVEQIGEFLVQHLKTDVYHEIGQSTGLLTPGNPMHVLKSTSGKGDTFIMTLTLDKYGNQTSFFEPQFEWQKDQFGAELPSL